MGTGLTAIQELVRRSSNMRRALRNAQFESRAGKTIDKRYGLKEAEALVGRTSQTIRDNEAKGTLPKPELDEKGRRLGFTLEQINAMRDRFGTRMRRAPEDPTAVIAIQNFKGGVGKTTTSVHLAQYLSQSGLRALLVDCDPQASSTAAFGLLPDDEIDLETTLYPYLIGEERSLHYAVRRTYWDGLSLIPANLQLYGAEYELAETAKRGGLEILNQGIKTIADDFDVIILDPPPALGMISLNVLHAANAMIIPMSPASYDLYSTISFFGLLAEALESIDRLVGETDYHFVRLLITRYDDQKPAQAALASLAREAFGHYVLKSAIKTTAELDNAGIRLQTLYELDRPSGSRRTYQRAINMFDAAHAEIEHLIRSNWPSHARSLRELGLL